MGKFIDLTGQRFGKLVVLYRNGTNKNKKAIYTITLRIISGGIANPTRNKNNRANP